MKTRRGGVELLCPVRMGKESDDTCGNPILVWASPYIPARGWDPPEGGVIEDVEAKSCDHEKELNSGSHDEALWEQLEDVDGLPDAD